MAKLKKGVALGELLEAYEGMEDDQQMALKGLLKTGEIPATLTDEDILTEVENAIEEMRDGGILTDDEHQQLDSVIDETRDARQTADEDDDEEAPEDDGGEDLAEKTAGAD